MEIYLVGGAVRDKLLGLEPKERDWVVVGSTPQEMLARGFTRVGKDFPVFLHPETKEEYALARTERKSGRGYHGFEVHASPEVTLEEDLARRDLTINAIAEAADGTLIDPFNGREDLDAGRLRHVSNAFIEDPVRVLRIARFAARFGQWGFRVAHGTNALMRRMVENGEVDHLVAERVWQELAKTLADPRPSRFFEVLRGCGALARIFPELDRLWGVQQPAHHHPEGDAFAHTMLVLEEAAKLSPEPVVRFAALLHDLGKGETPAEEWPKHHGHDRKGAAPILDLCERLRAPNEFRDLAVLTARYHHHTHKLAELRPTTIVDTLDALDAYRRPERFARFLLACKADSRGRTGHEENPYPQADDFERARRACAAINARELAEQGLKGPEIRDALRHRRIAAVRALHIGVDSEE
ncbi:multifunctional CCA addition/repair protein [Endothiovibrio diazotrophicus]